MHVRFVGPESDTNNPSCKTYSILSVVGALSPLVSHL
mgnify:CR=1 FL=1